MNKVFQGDCLDVLKTLDDNSVDSIVTDPPYELGFMGKSWDNTGIANNPLMWSECLRVLKPGGHLLAFSGTRTYHRMAVAIEDAGFEVRDMIEFCYGSGFPKSLNVWKQLKKKCECGNMEVYEKRIQLQQTLGEAETEYEMRLMQEADLSQTINSQKEQGEVLQSGLSEQSTPTKSMQLSDKIRERQPSVEGRGNDEKNSRELSGSDLSKMPKGIPTNGEERRLHNATQVSNGSTFGKIIRESGSGTSQRPQSEQQQYKQPCAFCKQYGTQAIRTLGVGTALKPAHEPICMARKPLAEKTIALNVLKYGTGGINIDESRVDVADSEKEHFEKEWDRDQSMSAELGGVAMNKELKAVSLRDNVPSGRFPANLIHDNSEEVRECFPDSGGGKAKHNSEITRKGIAQDGSSFNAETCGFDVNKCQSMANFGDSGNASRFFYKVDWSDEEYENLVANTSKEIQDKWKEIVQLYEDDIDWSPIEAFVGSLLVQDKLTKKGKSIIYQAKASKSERNKGCGDIEEKQTTGGGGLTAYFRDDGSLETASAGGKYGSIKAKQSNNHPTVKPIALMEYLIKMVTPKGGIVLDPFAGSGSTLIAAKQNKYQYIGIELEPEYITIAEARLNSVKETLL